MGALASKYDALISEVVSDFSKLEKRKLFWRKTDRLRSYLISEAQSPFVFFIEIGEDGVEVGLAFLPTDSIKAQLIPSAEIMQKRVQRRGSQFCKGSIEFYSEGPSLYRYSLTHCQPISVDGLVRDLRFFSDLFKMLEKAQDAGFEIAS